MLRALEKQLKKEKVKRIDTAVVTDNAGAARFYARMGTGRWGRGGSRNVVRGSLMRLYCRLQIRSIAITVASALIATRDECRGGGYGSQFRYLL